MSDNELERLRSNNLATFLRRGPGLCSSYRTWIEAHDRKRKRVLVGGLGGCGVGKMWFAEEERHAHYPGYQDAPEVEWHGGAFS